MTEWRECPMAGDVFGMGQEELRECSLLLQVARAVCATDSAACAVCPVPTWHVALTECVPYLEAGIQETMVRLGSMDNPEHRRFWEGILAQRERDLAEVREAVGLFASAPSEEQP